MQMGKDPPAVKEKGALQSTEPPPTPATDASPRVCAAKCMMFPAAAVQIAGVGPLLQHQRKAPIIRKPLAINSLPSRSDTWHLLCFEMFRWLY
jgi:hypothetical protein